MINVFEHDSSSKNRKANDKHFLSSLWIIITFQIESSTKILNANIVKWSPSDSSQADKWQEYNKWSRSEIMSDKHKLENGLVKMCA